jgi:hypothetical protein
VSPLAKPVLVLTNELDLAADNVIRRIQDLGYPVRRINAEAAAASPAPGWRSTECAVEDVGSVWWRQFELSSEPGGLRLSDAEELVLVRAQWRSWLSALDIDEIPWVNPLWAARRAEDKIAQLKMARLTGFAVPETIVTNDRAEALAFAAGRPCVVKTLSSAYFELSGRGFVYTHALDDPLLADSEEWLRQPLIVQRRVSGTDVRVIVVGCRIFGASCTSTELDWRTQSDGVTWQRWSPPDRITLQCMDYVRRFNLKYAAFDFKDDGQEVWFLEANQAGEWAFLDRPLRLGIAEGLTDLLVRLACGPS